MIGDHEACGLGYRALPGFDFRVEKFFHMPAVQTHQVVVMLIVAQLIHRFAGFEVVAAENARLLELRENAVNSGQANVGPFSQEYAIDVFGRQMALLGRLKDFQNFQPRQGCLQASAFEFVDIIHSGAATMSGRIVHELGSMFPSPRTRVRSLRRTLQVLLAAGLAAALITSLSACSSFNRATESMADALTLYKPEVVQGNFVSKEQVAALQPGMTRLQVRDILGTPLLASVFHADRWDYVFTMRRQRVEPQNYRLTLFFEGDALVRYEGDDMPSETEFVERLSSKREVKVPQLEATEEQLERFPISGGSGAATGADSAENAVPVGNYPPLEAPR